MTQAYFKALPEQICSQLSKAQRNIRVAVCWFSHADIFHTLLARLQAGVQVELLLEYDTQNIRDEGLDFQKFIQAGGRLYAHREAGLMHHKFAMVDDQCLFTGSFNWTYNSNAENLMVTDDTNAICDFRVEFEQQRSAALRVFKVRKEEAKVFSAYPLFVNTSFYLADLRKKVSVGAGVWMLRLDKLKADKCVIFRENRIPFDSRQLFAPCWHRWRVWDEQLFDEALEGLANQYSSRVLREIRLWSRRMKTGDIVLATERKNKLLAIGIIQSDPQRFEGDEFSSFRDVQWLKVLPDEAAHQLLEAGSTLGVAKFRGSALRLLQEVFGG